WTVVAPGPYGPFEVGWAATACEYWGTCTTVVSKVWGDFRIPAPRYRLVRLYKSAKDIELLPLGFRFKVNTDTGEGVALGVGEGGVPVAVGVGDGPLVEVGELVGVGGVPVTIGVAVGVGVSICS